MSIIYFSEPQKSNICKSCGKTEELRLGVCFECALSGEERASKRTVLQHIKKCIQNLKEKNFEYAKYDITWAWQRLTRTGDYKKDGTFDLEGYSWRKNNGSLQKFILPRL